MAHFTNIGPYSGLILWHDDLGAIEVFRAPDDRSAIGKATPVGRTKGGIALWELTVGGARVLGRWLVLGRQFLAAPGGGRPPWG
jgi:hypothetical protein